MAEETGDIRSLMHSVIQEFVKAEQVKAEPAYKAELLEERRRRESLEQRVNELVAENERSRVKAEEAERCAAVRGGAAEAGSGKDRAGVPGGEGRDPARRGRAAAGGGRIGAAGISGAVRGGESGAAAGKAGGRIGCEWRGRGRREVGAWNWTRSDRA